MADLKQVRYRRDDGSYTDALRSYAGSSGDLIDQIQAGTKRRLLDALGRTISEVDEATGNVTRTRFSDGADGPRHTLVHDSASPALDDVIGRFAFRSRNDAGALFTGVELRAIVKNAAAGSEEVWFEAGLMNGGSFVPAGLSLRIVSGAVKLYIDGVEAGTGGGGFLGGAAVNRTTNQSLPNGAHTAINFDTEIRDDGNLFDSSNSTRLVAQASGWYTASGMVGFNPSNVGLRQVAIRVDGTTIYNQQRETSPSGTIGCLLEVSQILYLEESQFVEIIAFQNSGGSLDAIVASETPYFSMVGLG